MINECYNLICFFWKTERNFFNINNIYYIYKMSDKSQSPPSKKLIKNKMKK